MVLMKIRNVLGIKGLDSFQAEKLRDMLTFEWEEQGAYGRTYKRRFRSYRYDKDQDVYFVPQGFLEFLPHIGVFETEAEDLAACPTLERPITSSVVLRPEQMPMSGLGTLYRGGLFSAPPGFGKTSVAISQIIAPLQTPSLIIVNTNELREQWHDRLLQQSDVTEDRIGVIGGGKWEIGDVTVALWQTLTKRMEEIRAEDPEEYRRLARAWGLVFVDEAHGVPAAKLSAVLAMLHARHKWGCTATPYRSDTLSQMIQYILGPMRQQATREGQVPVYFQQIAIPDTDYRANDWMELRETVANHAGRAEWVVRDIAARAETPCLVLFKELKALEYMYETMRRLRPDAVTRMLIGKTPKKERKEIREAGERGEIDFVFSSTLADQGLDWPPLRTICLTYPGSYSGKVIQQTGRVARIWPGKERGTILDYCDGHGITRRQARQRRITYKAVGYQDLSRVARRSQNVA